LHFTSENFGYTFYFASGGLGCELHFTSGGLRYTLHFTSEGLGYKFHYTSEGLGYTLHFTSEGLGYTLHFTSGGLGYILLFTSEGVGYTLHFTSEGLGCTLHFTNGGLGYTLHFTSEGLGCTLHLTIKKLGYTLHFTSEGAILPLLLYGAPVWIEALEKEYNKKVYNRVQRLINIKIAKDFRTTSNEALCTLSGLTPIVIKAEEAVKLYSIMRKSHVQGIYYEVQPKDWIHPANPIRISDQHEQQEQHAIQIFTDGGKSEHGVELV
jgi:hypothetical protein